MIANLLSASVLVKVFFVFMRVLSKRLVVVWRMRYMLIWFGVKFLRRIWNWRVVLYKLFTRNIRVNCWFIIVRRRLIGRKISTIKLLLVFSSSCRIWVISFSLLFW